MLTVISKMDSTSVEVNRIYNNLKEQALERNDRSVATWSKYKSDLEVTKSLLSLIPKKVTHKVMAPLGPKALVPGKIIHTNEFLVNLGETWFVKRTASQTLEICDRRIKTCDEMLKKLEKERELVVKTSTVPTEQEAFGNDERPEIIEYSTVEEENEWRRQHRVREKEYHKKLAELRNKEKKPIETEKDLWDHLDELELQEELEDELNRLNAENSSGDDLSENSEADDTPLQDHDDSRNSMTKVIEEVSKKENVSVNTKSTSKVKVKRKVSFACDLDSLDEEPLRLEIKHSNSEAVPSDSGFTEIVTPSDIYNHYVHNLKKVPVSVLKSDINPNKEKELQTIQLTAESDSSEDDQYDETVKSIISGIKFKDVMERNVAPVEIIHNVGEKTNKISKFKAQRMKNL